MKSILGISAFYHDSAACLLKDGKIVAAAQEERFTRKKHQGGWPEHSIRYLLKLESLKLTDIDYVTFTYDGSNIRFYVDGLMIYQNNVTDNFPSSPVGTAYIGKSNNPQWFPGNIDNLEVWEITLSQQEIQQYMRVIHK